MIIVIQCIVDLCWVAEVESFEGISALLSLSSFVDDEASHFKDVQMIGHNDNSQDAKDNAKVSEEWEVSRHTTAIVFEILDDISGGPFTVF